MELKEPTIVVSFCDYFATGEGRTLMIVLGYSPSHTEKVFKDKFNEYFVTGMDTCPVDNLPEDYKYILECIPKNILDSMKRLPEFSGEFFMEYHYNLS